MLYLNSAEIARAPGGKAGRWHASSAVASGTSDLPAGFDTGAPGGASGASTTTSGNTGGGAVALNFATFPASNAQGGTGTLTGANGNTGGYSVPSLAEWGIVQGGGLFTRTDGLFQAGDGAYSGTAQKAAFACGGGANAAGVAGAGGLGAGAGGGAGTTGHASGAGGAGYAYLIFVAKTEEEA